LASVLDVRMNDGNIKDYVVSGGIGLISSRLNVEGPIEKDDGSFIVSARRTYADVFLKLSRDTNTNRSSLYFYDINAKANYKLGDKDRIYLSGYFGKDALGLGNTFGLIYGNSTGTLRWNHIFNSRLFSNTSLIYSKYSYDITINSANNNIGITSYIEDYHFKEDMQYYANADNKLNFGIDVIRHATSPGEITASKTSSFNPLTVQSRYSLESAAYISHDLSVIRAVAHRILVMKDGVVIEQGETEMLLRNPQMPYTQALLQAVAYAGEPDVAFGATMPA